MKGFNRNNFLMKCLQVKLILKRNTIPNCIFLVEWSVYTCILEEVTEVELSEPMLSLIEITIRNIHRVGALMQSGSGNTENAQKFYIIVTYSFYATYYTHVI